MEHFFRRFKTEWMPRSGYKDFAYAVNSIVQYITGYYNGYRPHQKNKELSPLKAEQRYFKPIMWWPNLVDHNRRLGWDLVFLVPILCV